ncbi:sugar phosphate nucleotidyltransferase [Candidatus Lariskella endosymbiont of Hedychridium roseum]|uniref:sugar phosphate nucleotidyltransferase n=1 Tax=Candidatus Lariskella endosymbiont of Hedychridium roseum TaxID=3077949 RepID=UPI0030D61F42
MESAISYIQSGEYFWNSGYFLVKASKYLSVIYDLEPEILRYCKEIFADKVKNKIYNLRAINTEYVKSSINRLQRMNVAYENIECLGTASNKSIDEILSKSRCELMTMVELKEIEWADLGSWKSRFEVSKKDAKNNFM